MKTTGSSLSKIYSVTLSRRLPPLSIEQLAEVLELDLMTSDRAGFRRHLRLALNDARRQGSYTPN